MTFGENLKALRLDRELTQMDLAKKLGTSQAAVCSWENGTREPNFEMCEKLANALGVPVSSIVVPKDKVAGDGLVQTVADAMHNNPKRRLLFDMSMKVTDSDLDAVLAVLRAITKEREEE